MKRSLVAVAVVACAGAACSAQTWFFGLDGLQEVPSISVPATGFASVTYHPATDDLSWEISWAGLSGVPTAMHFHIGAPGTNGPHGVHIHSFTLATTGTAVGSEPNLTPAFVNALLAGNVYVNIHTINHGGGEIRGQVVPAPGVFAALGLGGLMATRRRR